MALPTGHSEPECERLLIEQMDSTAPAFISTKVKAGSVLILGLALTLCGAIALSGDKSAAKLDIDALVGLQVEQPSYVAFSWRIDPSQPFLVGPGRLLFDYADDDVTTRLIPKLNKEEITSSGVRGFASEVSAQVGISGGYNWGTEAFSGAANASFQSMTSAHVKQFRYDSYTTVQYQHISATPLFPFEKLRPDAKRLLLNGSVSQIVKILGEFYTTSAYLGGIYQETVTMDKRATDTEASLQASITANYKGLSGAAGASLSGGASTSAMVGNRAAKVKLRVLGGDTRKWLALTAENHQEIQDAWSHSVTEENLYPVKIRLVPIWELLEDPMANPAKALELQNYLVRRWEETSATVPDYPYVEEVSSCPSCSNLIESLGHERCEPVPGGFKLSASQGLKFKQYGLDDDDHENIASANECALAAFGDGGTVDFSVESSSKSAKLGSHPDKWRHWDGAWYSDQDGYGKPNAQFRQGSTISWNFAKGDKGNFEDKDKAVTELTCHFLC